MKKPDVCYKNNHYFCNPPFYVVNILTFKDREVKIYHHPLQAYKGHFTTGHSVGGGAPVIPLKAAQWSFETKKLDVWAMKYLDRRPSRLTSGVAPV